MCLFCLYTVHCLWQHAWACIWFHLYCVCVWGGLTAIRFGRIPQSEKQRLKAEQDVSGKEQHESKQLDTKSLTRQMHEAYLKHFHMNKAKARVFLTGKTSTPVSDCCVEESLTHSSFMLYCSCNFKAEQNDACLNTVHYSREFPNVFVSWTPFDLNIYMKYPLKFEFKFVVISVIFTTHALQTCMVFFFLRTVKDTFWRILLTKQIWFLLNSNVFFVHSKEVGGNWNCEYQHSSKCVQQKKEIHTCLKLHEGDSVFSSAHQACIYLI